MPDKGKPGSRWFVAGHAFVALAGVIGALFQPSPSLRSALSQVHAEPVVYVWSIAFVLFGASAIWARLAQRYRAETIAVDATAAVVLLWAAALLTTRSTSAAQLALVLVALVLIVHGWAVYRRSRVDGSTQILRAWVDEVDRESAVRGDEDRDRQGGVQ